MKKRSIWVLFWALVFIGAFLTLSQIGYSDGDDAYFYRHANSMGFFEYLGWRYETWVGRLAAEALVYVTFRLGLGFWRAVNAGMLILLPIGVLRLAAKVARVPEGGLVDWRSRCPACASGDYRDMGFGAAIASVAGYFLMSVMTLGYAAVWVNGSIFYTWSFTCGIWALVPAADFVFRTEPAVRGRWHVGVESGGVAFRKFLCAIVCSVIAAMSIEQMGAVLLVFLLLALVYGILKWRRVHLLLAVQAGVTLLAYGVLFAAQGNHIRVAEEILTWMPEFETMPLGQHLFITLHWLLSSFANENKLFLCGIWIAGILLLLQKKNRTAVDAVCVGLAGVFTAAALLPYVGVKVLSEFGMQYLNITSCIEHVPEAAKMTGMMNFAMLWWALALLYTAVFLWRASGCQITLLLAYLAGIASEAIMFFSPTMYASGARVYYLTNILYLFVILSLAFGIRKVRWRNAMYGILASLGAVNFLYQLRMFAWML